MKLIFSLFIFSVAVWSSLARLCVKARRLDVAGVCLGNMKDTRGMMTLRQAQQHPEIEAKLAALAVHLGLIVRTCLVKYIIV